MPHTTFSLGRSQIIVYPQGSKTTQPLIPHQRTGVQRSGRIIKSSTIMHQEILFSPCYRVMWKSTKLKVVAPFQRALVANGYSYVLGDNFSSGAFPLFPPLQAPVLCASTEAGFFLRWVGGVTCLFHACCIQRRRIHQWTHRVNCGLF